MLWYIAYGIAHAIFVVDAALEYLDHTTISEWVWDKAPESKRWVWYVGAVVAFNILFWTVSAGVAFAFLGGWLMAHLQGAR